MIGMISAAVDAVLDSVTALPAFDVLVADKAKGSLQVEHELQAKRALLNSKIGEANDMARNAQAKLEEEHAAALHRASIKVAKDARELAPLFVEYRLNPSRKVALEIAAVIKKLDDQSRRVQGVPLDHFVVLTTWVEALVSNGEGEDLKAVFSSLGAFSNGPVEAATALVRAACERSVSEIEDALYRLESALDTAIRFAPRESSDDAFAAFAEIARHSHPSLRAAAITDFEQQTGASRQAAWAAGYVAPINVVQDGNVGLPGVTGGSHVVFSGGPAVVTDDEGNESIVEKRDPHFERLAAEAIDMSRLDQP